MTQGFTKGVPIDTDPTLAANSNQLVPSQAAVVSYVTNSINAHGAGSITGDTGGPLSQSSSNWNILGSGSITTSGASNTLTTQLTGLTNHAILVGAGTSTITKLALGSAGQVLQSGGAGADPVFSTATYPATATGTGTFLRADGTNWVASSSTLPNTNAQGDIIYGSASNVWTALAKDTNATRYLSNTGTSNNPAWAQVNLANGVTGVLPAANGGWGQIVTNYGIAGSSTTSGSYVDVTSATATITPVSASNRIMVIFCFASLAAIGTGSNPIHYQQIVRGASTVITGTESMINSGQNATGTVGVYTFITMMLLDSPATTSATAYKLQHKVNVVKSCTSQNIYITLIEVSA